MRNKMNTNAMELQKTDFGARQTTKCFEMQPQYEKRTCFKEKIRRQKYTRNLALLDGIKFV